MFPPPPKLLLKTLAHHTVCLLIASATLLLKYMSLKLGVNLNCSFSVGFRIDVFNFFFQR